MSTRAAGKQTIFLNSGVCMWQHEKINSKAFDYYPSLAKVRNHFESNYSQSISLSDAATIAGVERKHFGKLFRHTVGIGFKEWTIRLRIQKAMEAIREQHQRISDIAFSVGFQDLRTFERAFKKQTGVTPREFSRRI